MAGWLRPAWVEVDLSAITANVAHIAATVAPATVCAIVKADGYGHGAVPVAGAALAGGAAYLGVALAEEGHELRQAGIGCRSWCCPNLRPERWPWWWRTT